VYSGIYLGKFFFSPGGAGVLRYLARKIPLQSWRRWAGVLGYLARKIPLQSWRRWCTQVFSSENSSPVLEALVYSDI
jgi:hypothetical protein